MRADVDSNLVVTLAGRAAEDVLLGSVSVGAEMDLAEATATVAAAHASAGLGASLVHRAASPDAIALVNVDPDLRAIVDAHLADVYSATVALVRGEGTPHATCLGGSTSYSEHHRGTCSHHGGVTSWR